MSSEEVCRTLQMRRWTADDEKREGGDVSPLYLGAIQTTLPHLHADANLFFPPQLLAQLQGLTSTRYPTRPELFFATRGV